MRVGLRGRGQGVPWLVDTVVVVGALLTVTLLVFSARLTSTTFDRSSAWDRGLAAISSDVELSHLWLEEAIAGDRSIDVDRQVFATIARARSRCLALRVDGEARESVTRLCSRLRVFGALAARRWASRRSARAGSEQDTAFDAAFTETLRLADDAFDATAAAVARRRTTLHRLNIGIVLGALLLFGGMTLVVGRRAKQLAAHNARLRELDRLKDNFIASVSHELRTPLTSTIGFLQTVERPDLSLDEAQRRELIGIARVQAERLAGIVDELLLFSQAQTGGIRVARGDVDLGSLLAECVRATEPLARAKGVSVRVAAGAVPPVRGDRERLAQLLDNLVSNAVKFTPAGGTIDLRAHAADGRVRLEIADTGVGIPAGEQPHLFDRFFRSSLAVEQAVPGAGLGLAISKAIVDAHEGAIEIESEEGRGTTVVVELPAATEAA